MSNISTVKPVIKNIAIDKLYENPDNIRFSSGQTAFGIKVKDTRNIESMCMVVRDNNGIPERLTVEDMGDGKYKVLKGNRRLGAAKKLIVDPTTSQELVANLQQLPCEVYKDLTDTQRNELINDQRSQKFMRSELVAYIFRLQRNGLTFSDIALHIWPQMGQYTAGGAKKQAEVERCTNDAERKKIILSWLKGTLDQTILASGRCGPRVMKALLLTEMQTDGILPEGEKPEFYPGQVRCGQLIKAKNESPDWTPENGSESFNALVEKFHAEDFGTSTGDPKAKRLTENQLIEADGRTKSKAAKAALAVARGLKPQHFANVDDEAYRLERLIELSVKYYDGIKNDAVKETLKMWLNADAADFENFLAANS